MKDNTAFIPVDKTSAIAAVTSSPPAGIQVDTQKTGTVSLLALNPGPNLVWLGYGVNAATATANSVAPVSGTPVDCLPLPPSSLQVFTMTAGLYYSGLSIGGAQTIYLTPGQGL